FLPVRATMAPSVQAIRHILRGAIVSRGHDSPLLHNYRANATPQAIGPLSDRNGDPHEVLVRIRPAIFFQAHSATSLFHLGIAQKSDSNFMMIINSRG